MEHPIPSSPLLYDGLMIHKHLLAKLLKCPLVIHTARCVRQDHQEVDFLPREPSPSVSGVSPLLTEHFPSIVAQGPVGDTSVPWGHVYVCHCLEM